MSAQHSPVHEAPKGPPKLQPTRSEPALIREATTAVCTALEALTPAQQRRAFAAAAIMLGHDNMEFVEYPEDGDEEEKE